MPGYKNIANLIGTFDPLGGYMAELSARVEADRHLDRDGVKHAVRCGIAVFERQIECGPTGAGLSATVTQAFENAHRLVGEGQSRLARAAVRAAAETLLRERGNDPYRSERIKTLYGWERDIGLAVHDSEAAADAVVAMAKALHGDHRQDHRALLISEGDRLLMFGNWQNSIVYRLAAVFVRRATLHLATVPEEIGFDQHNLGSALTQLIPYNDGWAYLDEAVAAFQAALEVRTRERTPLDWAATQNDLGMAFLAHGEHGDEYSLGNAMAAFESALQERTRERVPLDWAATQNNIGTALSRLGQIDGTPILQQAVAAFRTALEERTREKVPLDWAATQTELGWALCRLGEYELERQEADDPAHLEEAAAAFRAALEVGSRDRMPLAWAEMQGGLGKALRILGGYEGNAAHLNQAAAAYRLALEEYTRDRAPIRWAEIQCELGRTLKALGECESGTARLEDAVVAFRVALEEQRRGYSRTLWAFTQTYLGNALEALAARQDGTASLTEAIAAYDAALAVLDENAPPGDYWAGLCREYLNQASTELTRRGGVSAGIQHRAGLSPTSSPDCPDGGSAFSFRVPTSRTTLAGGQISRGKGPTTCSPPRSTTS